MRLNRQQLRAGTIDAEARGSRGAAGRGFTIIELITSVALLVLVMLAVGLIFRSASRAVAVSQATSDVFTNARAGFGQLDSDFSRIDRNGFLVIRSRVDAAGHRVDQVAFITSGSFAHRTGSRQPAIFDDPIVSDAALVCLGHVAYQATPDQTAAINVNDTVPAGGPPSGVDNPANPFYLGKTDGEYRFGRRALLLMTPSGMAGGTPLVAAPTYPAKDAVAFASPALTTANVVANATTDGSVAANIASSRVDAVALTPQQLMNAIMQAAGMPRTSARFEADTFCFRSYAPANAFDVEAGVSSPLVGAMRMNTVMLPGCRSFAVDWSDGTVDGNQQLVWYGLGNPKLDGSNNADPAIQPAVANGDGYTAQFSYDNRTRWPKLLRLTYRIRDARDAFNGGRVFTQVVRLP